MDANELDQFSPDWLLDGKGLRGNAQDEDKPPLEPAHGIPEDFEFAPTTPIDDTPGNTDDPPSGGGFPDLNVYNNAGTLVYTGNDTLTIKGKAMRWQEVEWCTGSTTQYRLVLTCAPYSTSLVP